MLFHTTVGIDPVPLTITATTDPSVAGVRIDGPSEAAAREIKVRVESALRSVGIAPSGVVVHVGSAALDKIPPDSALDLPIALEAACLMGAVDLPAGIAAYGELALNGQLRAVRGMSCRLAAGLRAFIPEGNADEAAAFIRTGDEPVAFALLADVIDHLNDGLGGRSVYRQPIEPAAPVPIDPECAHSEPLALLVAMALNKRRALVVAPPGAGTTILARNVARALPPLSVGAAAEVTRVHSAAGLVDRGPIVERPFRAPHHTVSTAGLVGGGHYPRPGEVSLAHRGVLMLDDVVEFRADALKRLARTLEECEAWLQPFMGHLARFPAHPAVVIATARPCPCGYLGSSRRTCRCSDTALTRHRERLDAAQRLLEAGRIDLSDAPDSTLRPVAQA